MPEVYKTLAQQSVPNSPSTVYTAPANKQSIVRQIILVNSTGSDATIELWANGSATVNFILPPTTILAGGHAEFNGAITLATGESILAQGGTNLSISMSVFGVEST